MNPVKVYINGILPVLFIWGGCEKTLNRKLYLSMKKVRRIRSGAYVCYSVEREPDGAYVSERGREFSWWTPGDWVHVARSCLPGFLSSEEAEYATGRGWSRIRIGHEYCMPVMVSDRLTSRTGSLRQSCIGRTAAVGTDESSQMFSCRVKG